MSFGRCGSSNLWLSGSHCLCLETSRYGLYLMARESCLKTLEGHISSVLTALCYPCVSCALASAWCFLDGYNAKDVCNMSTASSTSPSSCSSSLLGHTELRLHMPPSIALASRGRLQGLRLQLALLDREFDDLDYETLRALDSDNVSTAPSMSEEIDALPVHK